MALGVRRSLQGGLTLWAAATMAVPTAVITGLVPVTVAVMMAPACGSAVVVVVVAPAATAAAAAAAASSLPPGCFVRGSAAAGRAVQGWGQRRPQRGQLPLGTLSTRVTVGGTRSRRTPRGAPAPAPEPARGWWLLMKGGAGCAAA